MSDNEQNQIVTSENNSEISENEQLRMTMNINEKQ